MLNIFLSIWRTILKLFLEFENVIFGFLSLKVDDLLHFASTFFWPSNPSQCTCWANSLPWAASLAPCTSLHQSVLYLCNLLNKCVCACVCIHKNTHRRQEIHPLMSYWPLNSLQDLGISGKRNKPNVVHSRLTILNLV